MDPRLRADGYHSQLAQTHCQISADPLQILDNPSTTRKIEFIQLVEPASILEEEFEEGVVVESKVLDTLYVGCTLGDVPPEVSIAKADGNVSNLRPRYGRDKVEETL